MEIIRYADEELIKEFKNNEITIFQLIENSTSDRKLRYGGMQFDKQIKIIIEDK